VTVVDEAHGAPPLGAAAPLAVPAAATRLPRRHTTGAAILQAAAVFTPVALVLDMSRQTGAAMATALVITGIWVLALATTARALSVSSFAVGLPSIVAMGSLLGATGASAFSFWFSWIEVRPEQLALMAFLVFAVVLLCDRIALNILTPKRRLLIVGSSERASELVDELAAREDLPFKCVGIVEGLGAGGNGTRPQGNSPAHSSVLTEMVRVERPDLVVLAGEPQADAVNSLLDAGSLRLRIVGLPAFYEHAFGRVPVQGLSPIWFMSVLHLYQRPYSRITKRMLDIVLASVALAVLAPIMLVVAACVYLGDRGSVLYGQTRLGESGRRFKMLKFRTMVVDAETQGRAIWAEAGDPRVTRVGRFLRKARLDEAPQFWNVLRGDMSIVGPRPERPEFVELLAEHVPFWTRRHLVKPGITGWAQVRHRYTSDVPGTTEKLSYDLYYLKHRSLFLDLAIVAKTAKTVFSGSGAV
jgi:exopolysaccharide biosynthesis polyprenyl glycosylphosphotransferase